MWQKNDGTGADNILQNQFTSYLVTAVKRKKSTYLKGKEDLHRQELAMEQPDFDLIFQFDTDLEGRLSILEQIETPELLQALKDAKERERYIFLGRVLDERSFLQLSLELGITYKATTHAYYRFVERLRKQLGGENK